MILTSIKDQSYINSKNREKSTLNAWPHLYFDRKVKVNNTKNPKNDGLFPGKVNFRLSSKIIFRTLTKIRQDKNKGYNIHISYSSCSSTSDHLFFYCFLLQYLSFSVQTKVHKTIFNSMALIFLNWLSETEAIFYEI